MKHPARASPPRRRDPWFIQHPFRAKVVVAATFIVAFVVHLFTDNADAAILYVLPVALAALGFGLFVGTVAGVEAVMLLVVGVLLNHETLPVLSWCSRIAPLLLLGALAGASADRIREAREAERYAAEVALLQRDAAEVNDSVVQGIAAARWLLDAGQVERAAEVLDTTASSAQELVSRVLGSNSVLTDDVRMPHQVVRRRPTASAGD